MPPKIKDWLLSDSVTYSIVGLNEKIGAEGNMVKIIPTLIAKISVNQLPPENLAEELNLYFDLDQNNLTYLINSIKEKIFKPIEGQLLSVSVDINKIGMPITMKQEVGSMNQEAPTTVKQEAGIRNYGTESQMAQPVQPVKPFTIMNQELGSRNYGTQQKQFVRKEITLEGNYESGIMNQGTTEIEKFRPEIASPPKEDRNDAVQHPKPFILHEERPVAPPQVPPAPPIRQAPTVPMMPATKAEIKPNQEFKIPIKRSS